MLIIRLIYKPENLVLERQNYQKKLEFSETLSIRTNCQKILEAVFYIDSQVDNYQW